jgi:WD40 repeat protein
MHSGLCKQIIKNHTKSVKKAVFSTDSSILASITADNKIIRLQDTRSDRNEKILRGHSSPVSTIAFSPNNTYLASATIDNVLWIWNIQNGICERTLVGHTDCVQNIVFSSDGAYLASSSKDRTLRVWDTANGAELARVTSISVVNGCSWHPKNPYIVTAHGNGDICYWHVKFPSSRSSKKAVASLQLIWASNQKTLNVTNCNMNGVQGLSTNNADLLKQKGAVGKPALQIQTTGPSSAAQQDESFFIPTGGSASSSVNFFMPPPARGRRRKNSEAVENPFSKRSRINQTPSSTY